MKGASAHPSPLILAQLRQVGTVNGAEGIEHEDPPLTTGSAKMDHGDDIACRRMVLLLWFG